MRKTNICVSKHRIIFRACSIKSGDVVQLRGRAQMTVFGATEMSALERELGANSPPGKDACCVVFSLCYLKIKG